MPLSVLIPNKNARLGAFFMCSQIAELLDRTNSGSAPTKIKNKINQSSVLSWINNRNRLYLKSK